MTTDPDLIFSLDAGEGADAEELERLTAEVRDELEELRGVRTEPIAGVAPPGTKTPEIVALGALAVELAPTAIPAVAHVFESWLARDTRRSVMVRTADGETIVLTGATADERREVIAVWKARQERLLADA